MAKFSRDELARAAISLDVHVGELESLAKEATRCISLLYKYNSTLDCIQDQSPSLAASTMFKELQALRYKLDLQSDQLLTAFASFNPDCED